MSKSSTAHSNVYRSTDPKHKYGKGKRSLKRKQRRQVKAELRLIEGKYLEHVHEKLAKDMPIAPTPEQVAAWLNRSKRIKADPDSKPFDKAECLKKSSTANGGNKTQYASKAPNSVPQCALGHGV